jgi:hypothetical protein
MQMWSQELGQTAGLLSQAVRIPYVVALSREHPLLALEFSAGRTPVGGVSVYTDETGEATLLWQRADGGAERIDLGEIPRHLQNDLCAALGGGQGLLAAQYESGPILKEGKAGMVDPSMFVDSFILEAAVPGHPTWTPRLRG